MKLIVRLFCRSNSLIIQLIVRIRTTTLTRRHRAELLHAHLPIHNPARRYVAESRCFLGFLAKSKPKPLSITNAYAACGLNGNTLHASYSLAGASTSSECAVGLSCEVASHAHIDKKSRWDQPRLHCKDGWIQVCWGAGPAPRHMPYYTITSPRLLIGNATE